MNFVDMHCDTIAALLEHQEKGDAYGTLRENKGHIDLERLKKAGYLLQNFALFVFVGDGKDPFEKVQRLADLFDQEIKANQDIIAPVRKFSDIGQNQKAGKLSALLTVEEGAVCKGEIEKLHLLYDRGVRMLTLTWNFPNELGYPNITMPPATKDAAGNPHRIPDFKTPNTTSGLTEKGIDFVQEMERIGMIIDTSHLSDAGFYDVLQYTKKPFVASHSNARAVCNNIRNLTDDMIRKLADRGGVTGLNFAADFLTEMPQGQENPGTMEAVIAHAKHIVNVGGIECLGLGSDFDGIPTNEGIPDASHMPGLAECMSSAGFTQSQIDKLCYQNVLRVYQDTFQ